MLFVEEVATVPHHRLGIFRSLPGFAWACLGCPGPPRTWGWLVMRRHASPAPTPQLPRTAPALHRPLRSPASRFAKLRSQVCRFVRHDSPCKLPRNALPVRWLTYLPACQTAGWRGGCCRFSISSFGLSARFACSEGFVQRSRNPASSVQPLALSLD